MKKIIVATFLCLFFTQFVSAQSVQPKRKAGLILYTTLGYKSNVAGFALPGIGFWYSNFIELKISNATSFFGTNSGFSTGLKIIFFANRNIFLSSECSFRRLFAGKFATDWNGDTQYVEYYIGNSSCIVPQIGVNYKIPLDANGIFVREITAFNIDYCIPLNSIQMQYLDGTIGTPTSSAWVEKTVYRKYGSGFGFSITASFYLQRPIKSK